MSIDVELSEDASDAYTKIKDKEVPYVIFKADDERTKIILDKIGEEGETFQDFKDSIPDDEPRFALFDLVFSKADGAQVRKLLFYSYIPDTYFGMDKLFFASAKGPLADGFAGVGKNIQANDKDDLDFEEAKSYFS